MTRADSVHSTPPLNTSSINPMAGLDRLDVRADASPDEVFIAIGRLRKDATDEIERLIQFLDKDDYVSCELEDDGDLEPDTDEPSLGFLHMTDQTRICEGDREFVDSEDEHDGAEPDEDGEPSLGSLDQFDNQETAWSAGEHYQPDFEEDPAESGIADNAGLREQMGRQDWQPGVFG